jgi:peptidoglycan hydrolase-like protein with peptidoglycan-binding domain
MKYLKIFFLILAFFLGTNFANAEKYPDFCEVFTKEIYRGQTGEDVLELQKVLMQEGYKNVTATGIFGLQSAEAIRKIQTANGRYPFGKIGPDTFSLLKSLWCSPEPVVDTDMEMDIYPTENKAGNIVVVWQTKNANSCTLNNQNVDTEGTKKYQVLKKQNVYLTCVDSKGQSVRKKLALQKGTQVGKMPNLTASISKVSYKAGEDVEIRIQTEDADSCSVNKVSVPVNGVYLVKAKTTNEKFVVSCENKGKKVTKTLGAGEKGDMSGVVSFEATQFGNNVKVNCVNKSPDFNQNTNRLFGSQQKGAGPCEGNVYISWKTHDVKSCTATGFGFKDKPAKLFGGENITILNNRQDFKLSCIKNDGIVFEKELKVQPLRIESEELDFSISSDKTQYLPGEMLKLNLVAKNNTGREIFYFNSFPCTFTAPFALYVNGKNYEEVFGEQKNVCKNKGENLDFSYIPVGGSITKEVNLEIPKKIEEGNKKIRLLFANNLYGINGVPKDLDIFVGKQKTFTESSGAETKLSLSVSTDKKVYQKGDTLVATVKYRNDTSRTLYLKKINCDKYDGNLIYINGIDMYDYFNSYSQQICKSPKVSQPELKPGEEINEIYRAVIDTKKRYPTEDIKIELSYSNDDFIEKSEGNTFKIVETGASVNFNTDGKPFIGKSYKVSWLNGLYGSAQGILLELVKYDPVLKQNVVVGTIKKIPSDNTYYTPNGEYVWNIPSIINNENESSQCLTKKVDGVCSVKIDPGVNYKIKATFFDNRLACFGNCELNIKPNILGSVISEEFKFLVGGTSNSSSGQINLISKLENYIKVKLVGECGLSTLNWGDTSSETVNLTKTSTGSCEGVAVHTYTNKGKKELNSVSTSGNKSVLELSID